jgi:hypothetical protein
MGEGLNHLYGYSTALNSDGSIVGIGAVGYDENGSQSGYVQIYSNNNGNWVQIGSNLLGANADERFGSSISFDATGTRVAIGGPYHQVDGVNFAGHVQVFDYDGSDWVQVGGDIDPPVNFGAFGTSVKLNPTGEFLIVGAENHSEGTGNLFIGSTRVYRLNGGTWEQIGDDIDGDQQGDYSGFSVDINNDGSIIAISYYRSNGDTGKVKIFEKNSSDQWVQKGNELVGGGANYRFGYSINMNGMGNRIVVGEIAGGVPATGRVFVYDYISSTDTWNQVGQDILGEEMNDFFGQSVDITDDGSIIIIGAPGNGENAWINGEVKLFRLNGNTWSSIGTDINGEGTQDNLGSAVAMSSDAQVIAVGSRNSAAPGFPNAGIVEVFSMSSVLTIPENTLDDIHVFKNSFDQMHVEISEPGRYRIQLFDMYGKTVLQSENYMDDHNKYDVSSLNKGVYIFKLIHVRTGGIYHKKIVI